MMRRAVIVATFALLVSGVALLGRDAYLGVKGALAGRMVERALAAHLVDGRPHRPWRWADFEPIARLEVPRLGVARPVLTGASGESLAFGLGHVDGTANPGAPGHVVLAGHRDGWGSFMYDLQKGDTIRLVSHINTEIYEVVSMLAVPDQAKNVFDIAYQNSMTLITCYPAASYTASRQRFIVICDRA